jgi:peptide/nickel transport system substrate-binding protein
MVPRTLLRRTPFRSTPFRNSAQRLALGCAVLLASLTLAGGAWGQSVLRFVPQADLKNTDPIWTTAAVTQTHAFMIYDQLFAEDETFQIQPQMVDTWNVSRDGLTYTFTLRAGLRFHDGSPVRAADAVASLKRWGTRDTMALKMMAVVGSVEAVNDRTFRLVLKQPYPLVLQTLGKPSSNILVVMKEEVAAATDGFTQIKTNIGSGPFRMVESEWAPGNKVVYEKFKDYRPRAEPPSQYAGSKQVNVDRVEWIHIPNQATAMAALQQGEVDVLDKPDFDLAQVMERDARVRVEKIPLTFQGYMALNHLWPPFNNQKAREAMLYLVNQEDYVRSLIGQERYFMPFCGALFVCGTPNETDVGSEKLRAHDKNKARELLKEAGYDGYPIVVMDPTDFPVLHGAALVTTQKLREIGVTVDLQAMDWSTLTSRRAEKKDPKEGGWHIFHTWWTHPNLLLPVSHIGLSGDCDKAWFGWPCDTKLQELTKAWTFEVDAGKRKQLVETIQRRGYEFVPYVSFGQWQAPFAFSAGLKNMMITPTVTFWRVAKP